MRASTHKYRTRSYNPYKYLLDEQMNKTCLSRYLFLYTHIEEASYVYLSLTHNHRLLCSIEFIYILFW